MIDLLLRISVLLLAPGKVKAAPEDRCRVYDVPSQQDWYRVYKMLVFFQHFVDPVPSLLVAAVFTF